MNAFLNNFAFSVLTLFAVTAHAQQQSSMELTCRAKAKEIAAQAYSSCVTDARNTQIDQIRKDYQKQLADLKTKYDRELKKIGGKGLSATTPATTAKSTPVASSVSTGAAPKPTKGIAKTLPTRKEMKPAKAATPEVAAEDTAAPAAPISTEGEATQNDANSDLKIELVPAPAGTDKTAATTEEQSY